LIIKLLINKRNGIVYIGKLKWLLIVRVFP
jgi:hypothetical protein